MPSLSMKRMMLLSVVGRAIQEIEADPKRGLHRVVDLAQNFVHGDTASVIFSFLQQVLQKEDSSCYALLERMVREVSHKNLQHFIVALGWDSWSEGGRRLRQSAQTQSWAEKITVTDSDTLHTLRTQMKSYIDKGVRTFFVHVNTQKALYTALQIASEKIAILLFVPPALIDHQSAARIAICPAVGTVLYDQPERTRAQTILRRAKCLYGVYHICTEQSSAASVTAWMEQLEGPFFAIVQERDSQQAQEIVQQIAAFRQNPTLPIIPIAATDDFNRIQAQIDRKKVR